MDVVAHAPGAARARLLARVPWALVALLAVSAAVRFYRLDVGLPHIVWVDSLRFIQTAVDLSHGLAAKPIDMIFPGFYTVLLAALYRLLGDLGSYGLYLTARVVSAGAGVVVVGLTFALTRRLCGRPGATVAAALACCCVVSVTFSRIETAETVLLLFLTGALIVALDARPGLGRWILGGLLAGCALGTKFSGGYVLVFVVVGTGLAAYQKRSWRSFVLWSTAAVATAGAVLLLVTPWLLPNLGEQLGWLRFIFTAERYGQIGRIQDGYLDYLFSSTTTWEQPWLGTSLLGTSGPLVLLAGGAACLAALAWRRGVRPLVLALFCVGFLVLCSGPGRVKAIRYLLPILPAWYALIGWFVETFISRRVRWPRLATAGAALALVLVPAYHLGCYLVATSRASSNELALGWIREHVEPQAKVLLSPFFVNDLQQADIQPSFLDDPGSRQYRLPDGWPNPERDPIYQPAIVDGLRGAGVRYVVLNSAFEGGFYDLAENRRWFPRSVEAYLAFRQRLSEQGQLVQSVAGWRDGRLGPDIDIYQLAP